MADGVGAHLGETPGRGDRLPRVTSDVVISDRLRRALEDGPSIMVLCAPRGFGKSSQVAAWIRSRTQARIRYVWQGLPTGPTDRMEFWSTTYRALTGADPPTGQDPVASIYGILEKTLQPTTLVLDNFGYVSDESVDDELDEMVHQFPRLRLVVMVRTERAISAIANARPDGVVLRMADLAVDVDGMLSMAAGAGYRMSRAQAAEIIESVAGWPAVVRGLLREGSRTEDGALVPDWQVVERYARVVLADAEMRQFLPVLGVLSSAEEFSPDLGRALLGQDHWNSHFPSVLRTGIIEGWLQDGHDRFCIRPRLRTAIQAVVRRHDPDAYRQHHRELATWYDARNRVRPALTHAVEAGEWELAAKLMEDFWLELISDSPDLTRQMLARIPDRVVRASATLLVMRDYILIVDAAARTREAFRTGQMDVEHAAEQENYRLTLSQVLQLRGRGGHEAFRQVIEEGGTGAQRTAWAKPVQEQMPELLLQWAITILLTSDAASAAYAFRQAYRWAREQGVIGAKREAVAGLALCLAVLGHLNSAGQWLARLDEIPPGPAVAGLEGASAALVRELIASDRLDHGDLDHGDGLDAGRMRSARELPGLAAVAHYISVGPVLNRGSAMEKKVALTRAERALAALTPGRHGARITDATARSVVVDLSIATNQLERAHRGLEGADHTQPWVIVARARVALFEGRPEVTLSLTAGCGSISLTDIRHGLQAHLLRACAAMRVGRMAVAGDNLQEAVSLAEESGMIRPFALIPRVDLLRLDAEFPHVIPKRIIAAVTAMPQVFPKPRDQVRLSAREREVLQELATGIPLSQVAQRLYVTENTVKSQVRSIYRKLGVHARRDAIGRATALGLLSATEPGS